MFGILLAFRVCVFDLFVFFSFFFSPPSCTLAGISPPFWYAASSVSVAGLIRHQYGPVWT